MDGGRLILVGGGARSGKSAFALAYARRLGARRALVATAEPLDGEMRSRIARHRAERGDEFTTIEEPLALAAAIERAAGEVDVVLVDCLTLWLSNLFVRGADPGGVAQGIDELVAALGRRRGHVVIVTNEVGLGLVPETPLGRAFRDAAGLAHQRLAAAADEVYAALLGMVVRLAPAPVVAFRRGEAP
jgi:adenosylcobinamide kinase/adenosylcobinamide-phosphate guanylyltransferase